MKSQKGSVEGYMVLVIFALWGAAIIGWIWNVVKFVHMLDGNITGMFVARAIGIFAAPLGAILGYVG